MLEIPRNITANIWKLVLGAVLVVAAVLFALGDVKISVLAAEEQPSALVFQLEAMRLKACGHEAGVIRGAVELPSARAGRRS
jgi:hypothetical protein